jgi:hypothetical protein
MKSLDAGQFSGIKLAPTGVFKKRAASGGKPTTINQFDEPITEELEQVIKIKISSLSRENL